MVSENWLQLLHSRIDRQYRNMLKNTSTTHSPFVRAFWSQKKKKFNSNIYWRMMAASALDPSSLALRLTLCALLFFFFCCFRPRISVSQNRKSYCGTLKVILCKRTGKRLLRIYNIGIGDEKDCSLNKKKNTQKLQSPLRFSYNKNIYEFNQPHSDTRNIDTDGREIEMERERN